MFWKTQPAGKKNTASAPRSRWFAGALAGQFLGFAAVMLVAAPVAPVAVIASTLAGGFLGGLAGAKLKSKPQQRPANDNPRRRYAFQPLPEAATELAEKTVQEEYNSASGNGGGGQKLANKTPKLEPPKPTPMTPKMGGM